MGNSRRLEAICSRLSASWIWRRTAGGCESPRRCPSIDQLSHRIPSIAKRIYQKGNQKIEKKKKKRDIPPPVISRRLHRPHPILLTLRHTAARCRRAKAAVVVAALLPRRERKGASREPKRRGKMLYRPWYVADVFWRVFHIGPLS